MSNIDNQLDINIPIARKADDGTLKATSTFEGYLTDISLVAAVVADLTSSTVSIASADATDLPSVITLANEMKADINALVTDLNLAITQVNLLLTNLRASRKLDE